MTPEHNLEAAKVYALLALATAVSELRDSSA
jgi:hypothetical protein